MLSAFGSTERSIPLSQSVQQARSFPTPPFAPCSMPLSLTIPSPQQAIAVMQNSFGGGTDMFFLPPANAPKISSMVPLIAKNVAHRTQHMGDEPALFSVLDSSGSSGEGSQDVPTEVDLATFIRTCETSCLLEPPVSMVDMLQKLSSMKF